MAWARVSGREQEREGFSLDVQIDGLMEFGRRENATIDPIFRIAETATRAEERKKFKKLIRFAKQHAHEYDGILFYKIDRAARNLKDFVDLEELESEWGLPFIAITQPVQNTPTGRMMRRTLANMASFQTEQQSLDVREGIARRVTEGWFPSNPPFGYCTVRRDKRSYVVTDLKNSPKVKRIFELRAFERLTLDEIVERLFDEGQFYSDSKPKFSKTKVSDILHDKSYLGFIRFRGKLLPGRHEPIVDQTTWDLVRVSFEEQCYRSHELVYASELIRCGYCGHVITGEEKCKTTKTGIKAYIYYRCSRYRTPGHPSVRLTENELDVQLQEMLAPLQLSSDAVLGWVRIVARSILEARCIDDGIQVSETKRLLSMIASQREELLNLRLSGGIPEDTYTRKRHEFDERETILNRQHARQGQLQDQIDQMSEEAAKVFEILAKEWLTMERRARQHVLAALLGGFTLDGRTLVTGKRTPLELFRAG